MKSPPPPRLTARGVALFAAGYAVLALFYTATIEQWALQESVSLFASETLGLLPRSLIDYGLKGLLTVPVWWLAVRRLDGRPGLQVAAHVVLGPLWVWAWYVLYRALAPALGYGVLGDWGKAWDVFIPALVYLAQFGALHAARYVSEVQHRAEAQAALHVRQSELERAAQDAQLAALRAQMDPHFLFNTLNTVAASVPAEQGATRDLVARLAGLVRYTLAAARRDRVLLREELEFVRDYLALEQERMGERLVVEVDADADALDVPIPPMLIQPLVENAVRHGLAPTLAGGVLRVEVRRVGQAVHVLVRDDGAGPVAPVVTLLTDGTGEGVGLANTDARLRTLFGTGLALDVPGGDGQARGFEARFSIPIPADS
ncbi:sensor histidine kinase [Rubrivirga sp. IMCC43871]|uniref:sensor histidine kinase n=1 Tax=Rubrivirga sp. IMCC43871 TaxID=3391575 RepID=UPI00398FC387